jgi:hypothetical protein
MRALVKDYPAKYRTRILNIAKLAFKRMPAIAIQGLGSLRCRLKMPIITPPTAGITSKKALATLSVLVGIPISKDSNRVRSQSMVSETRNRISDIEANLIFISELLYQ